LPTIFYLIPLGLLVVFVFSLGARSLKTFSRHKLEELCRRRNAEKRLADIVKQHEDVAATVSLARIVSVALFLICVSIFSALLPVRDIASDSTCWRAMVTIFAVVVIP